MCHKKAVMMHSPEHSDERFLLSLLALSHHSLNLMSLQWSKVLPLFTKLNFQKKAGVEPNVSIFLGNTQVCQSDHRREATV